MFESNYAEMLEEQNLEMPLFAVRLEHENECTLKAVSSYGKKLILIRSVKIEGMADRTGLENSPRFRPVFMRIDKSLFLNNFFLIILK